MFSNTAYEALYRYLGLVFHSGSVQLITSEPFFKGLILITFGSLFMLTAWQVVSRHIFGNLVQRHSVPLSKFVKIAFCLVLGISILKVGGHIRVEDAKDESWSNNGYVKSRLSNVQDSYEVSFVFTLLSQAAEGIGKYMSFAADYIFGTNESSFLKSPFEYSKAIMLAGASTIDDDRLRNMTRSYTDNCLKRLLPDVAEIDQNKSFLDRFFNREMMVDAALGKITLSGGEGGNIYTCLDMKQELRDGLFQYADSKRLYIDEENTPDIDRNVAVSSMLVNHYRSERESILGLQKGSKVPGGTGSAYQYLGRIFSWDGFVSIFTLGSGSDTHGASEAASRAKEFSELLTRAPHLKGMVMLVLIAIFPWLVFFVVYGKWKVLVWWFWAYLSVCLWTPIWTIMYHIMNNIATAANSLEGLAPHTDAISLYSSQVILDRIYYLYSVFSMAQIAVPMFTTGLALYMLRPMLAGAEQESRPEFIDTGISAASTTVGLANAGQGVLNVAK